MARAMEEKPATHASASVGRAERITFREIGDGSEFPKLTPVPDFLS